MMELKNPLAIRKADRAIFEPSIPDDYTNREVLADILRGECAYYFRQLVPVKRSFWFGVKLVRSGAIWETNDESLFDVVERSEVMAGLKLL